MLSVRVERREGMKQLTVTSLQDVLQSGRNISIYFTHYDEVLGTAYYNFLPYGNVNLGLTDEI